MKFERTRKEFLAEKLESVVPVIADLLDQGFQVELSRSRSGCKLLYYKKQFQVIKGGTANVSEASR